MRQTSLKNKLIETYWLLAVDMVTIILAYLSAIFLRFGNIGNSMSELHYSTCLCFMLVSAVYSLVLSWNNGFIHRGYLVELIAILKYNLVMVFAVACFLFITSAAADFSRLIWGYVFVFNTIYTYLAHILVKRILREYYKSEHCRVKVVLVTDAADLETVYSRLHKSMPMNYDISAVVLVGDPDGRTEYMQAPVLWGTDHVRELSREIPMDEVFLHLNVQEHDEIRQMIEDFESMGVICHYSVDLFEGTPRESSVGKFGDYTVISYSIYHVDYARQIVKRLFDILGGLIGLLLTAVLYPFIAILIKIDSKGPVLFSQVRVGKNGRRFKIYKFRSMYVDAEQRKKELQKYNEMEGLMFKLENDPRITRVGKFLRKTSLDEFPQFYNVLRGDMSLIGTRPPTEDEFEQYSPYYRRRLCMTPGLTGLWQVSGRSEIEDFDQVVQLDLQYIENWSLTLDIKILLKTIWVVLGGKGAK